MSTTGSGTPTTTSVVYVQGGDLSGIKPPAFNWDKPEDFKKFKRYCELVLSTPAYSVKKPEEKVNYILLWMGPESLDVFDNLTLSDEDKKKPEKVWESFESYFEPKTNFRLARFNIQDMKQMQNEPIDTFVNRLKVQAKKCNYSNADQRDDAILDQIIKGTAHPAVRKKLLDEDPSKLKLDKAMSLARTTETTQNHMKLMNEDRKVDAVGYSRDSKRSQTSNTCSYCGQVGRHKRDDCKAKDQECRRCHKTGHFAKVCRSGATPKHYQDADGKGTQEGPTRGRGRSRGRGQTRGRGRGRSHAPTRKVHTVEEDAAESLAQDFDNIAFSTVSVHYVNPKNPTKERTEAFARLQFKHNGRNANLRGKIDTGAQGNILPLRTYRNMFPELINANGLPKNTERCDDTLTAYNGSNIRHYGTVTIPCRYNSTDGFQETKFYVADTQGPVIFGYKTCTKLGLVTVNCEITAKSESNKTSTQTFQSVEDLMKEYPDRFEGLGKLPGTCKLTLKPDAEPVIHPPRRAPIQLRDLIKKELERMIKLGVIRPVNEPTDWVSSITYVMKPDGTLRICLDPKNLNKNLKRPQHHTPTLEELTHKFANAKVFSKLDAKHGYWSMQLDPDSQLMTTFNSPFGRFCFKRLPFGLSVSQDLFQAKMDEILDGLQGVVSIADDITVYGETQEEHDRNLRKLMERAREKGLVFNPTKCHISQRQVSFFGNIYSSSGVSPDPAKVNAIQQIKRPSNVKELQSFLGLVTYLGPYIPKLSELTAPLRVLLQKDSAFQWHTEQEIAFETIKEQICKSTTLSYFQPSKPTVIQVDASQNSLGAALVQDGRPIAFASKSLTPTEKRYANIERELLACVFGAERFHTYLYGSKFTIESDHRPLDMISKKPLTAAPPRLQRMLLRLQKYDYEIVYRPGREMILPDSISRLQKHETDKEIDLKLAVCFVQFSTQKLNELREATVKDEHLNSLMTYINKGFPEKGRDLPYQIRNFWSFRDQLSIEDGLILKGNQVVIPESLKSEYLDRLHSSHQGITRTQQRAKSCIYYPGIYKDIETITQGCSECQKFQVSQQKETLDPIVTDIPNIPWHTIGSDFFQYEQQDYLIIADYYSKFLIVEKMSANPDSDVAAKFTRKMFSMFGIPNRIISDNGGQFIGKAYQKMVKDYGIAHNSSSPRHPKSHGFIESQVKIAEKLLKKSKDFNMFNDALLSHRTTPLGPDMPSPAELLFNRKIQGNLPIHTKFSGSENIIKTRNANQEKINENYNKSAKDLKELNVNETIYYQDVAKRQWIPGTIIGYGPEPRSYTIECEITGRKLRRNRVLIRPRKVTFQSESNIGLPSSDGMAVTQSQPEMVATPKPNNSAEQSDATTMNETHAKTLTSEPTKERQTDTREKITAQVNGEKTSITPQTRHSERVRTAPAWLKDYKVG